MLRAREDKALEVWVGRGRQLAGWLKTYKNVGLAWPGIMLGLVTADENGEVIEEMRAFDLTAVQEVYGLSVPADVPRYAVETRIQDRTTGRHKSQYAWKVLRLDQVDFDWLFDHPDFVPVDTEVDSDLAAESASLAQKWLEKEIDARFSSSSAGTYSGVATNVPSVPGAPSASTAMTVETLMKAMKRSGLIAR